MKKLGYLLIDGSNLAHASNAGTILKAGDRETQGIYGTLRAIRKVVSTFPMLKPIVLHDGPTNWRKSFYPEYKANRDKEPTEKYEIENARRRASLKIQMPDLKRGLRLLGVPQIVAMNLEADDLAGILSRRYADQGHKVMLISGDKDWLQLLRPGVGWFDTINDRRVTLDTFEARVGFERKTVDKATGTETIEWIGCPTPQAHLECKALQGDVSDNVTGVGGIGEKGAIDLVRRFGSVKGFFDAVEIDKVKVPKKLSDFCSSADKRGIFYRNLQLMDLAHPDIPKPTGLIVDNKPRDAEAFEDFCGEFAFMSMRKDMPGWLAPFNNQD